jgi:hypothetical protein
MPQPQVREVTLYADIGEVRIEVQTANCNRLLADGWALLGACPLTTVEEMAQGGSPEEQEKQKQPQDTQRYVRWLDGLHRGKETKIVN